MRNNPNRFAFLALTVLIVLALIVVLRERHSAPEARPEVVAPQPQPRKLEGTSTNPEPIATRQTAEVLPSADASLSTILVADAWGRPLDGALVFEQQEDQEWYDPSLIPPIGTSDRDGRVSLKPKEPVFVHVGKPGYLTQALQIAPGEEVRIQLAEGGQVSIQCKSALTGEPIPDIVVCLRSRVKPGFVDQRTEWHTVGESAIPASPVEEVVFRARTGADGRVVIRGPVPGEVGYFAVANDWTHTSGPNDERGVVSTGQAEYEMRFLPITALGYRVSGDELVFDRGMPKFMERARVTGLEGRWIALRKMALQQKYPDATIHVLPAGEKIDMTLVFRRAGEHQVSLPFMPVREFEALGPITIDAGSLPRADAGIVNVTIHMINADGSELTGVDFLIADKFGLPAKGGHSGSEVALPAGHYRLVAKHGPIAAAIGRRVEFDVNPPTGGTIDAMDVTVHLKHVLKSVIIETKTESPADISVRRTDNWRQVIQAGSTPQQRQTYLPPGAYEFFETVDGPVAARVSIGAQDAEPIVVRLGDSR